MQKKIVLITGATSGIGEATALLLAENNFNLILCGRRSDRLDALKNKLSDKTEITTLCFDVRDREAVKKAIASLPQQWKQIDVLINSAGNAHGLDPIQTGNLDDWDAMIDINVKGLLYVCHEIVPAMAERKAGHVINIGSIAGKEVYPNGNVYSASKFAVDALTRGMRIDLNGNGIKVTSNRARAARFRTAAPGQPEVRGARPPRAAGRDGHGAPGSDRQKPLNIHREKEILLPTTWPGLLT